MGRTFKLIKDYYDLGFDLFNKRTININEGVTVLVGCNGTGKTTLLNEINNQLNRENVPHIFYNNKLDGGRASMDSLLFYGRMQELAQRAFSSEGEEIVLNFGDFISRVRDFYKTGRSFRSYKEPNPEHKERWILFDAVDSGMSIDNMKEIKEIFELMIEDGKKQNLEVYIIISTNSFEFAKDSVCLDVTNLKYRTFKSYNAYSNFIMNSKINKNKRYEERN